MAKLDYYGLVSIIDSYFDKYYGKETPYNIERFSTIQSFIFESYKLLKSKFVFSSDLRNTYLNCINSLMLKLQLIENTRLNRYEVSAADSNSIISLVIQLYNKYIDRNFNSELPESERKSGYNDNYRQKIYVGATLVPTFDNDSRTAGIVPEKTENYILIDGTDKTSSSGVSFKFYFDNKLSTSITPSYSVEQLKEKEIPVSTIHNKGVSDLVFEQSYKNEDEKKYYTYVLFQNGFIVDTYNEYENPIGNCFDAISALYTDFLQTSANSGNNSYINIETFLKNYFYKTLLEKYRTNLINDDETKIRTYDLNPQNKFSPIPYIYEKLNGRGGLINTTSTNGYGKVFSNDSQNYTAYNFTSSYYDNSSGAIVFNIPKEKIDSSLRLLKKYNTYSGFLSDISSKYNSYNTLFDFPHLHQTDDEIEIKNDSNYLKEASEFINKNTDALKSDFLASNFFAVKPYFKPSNNTRDNNFTDFYKKNYKNIQKDFFYDNDYNTKIDVKFDTVRFTDKNYTTVDFSNGNDYIQDCLSVYIYTDINYENNVNLYDGVLYIKKLTQKLSDNDITKPISSNNVSRNYILEPNEFTTVLDDRDFEVVHYNTAEFNNYNGTISNTQILDGNIAKVEYPKYKKTTLRKSDGKYLLDCTDFSEYNDINTIEQIRVINLSELINYNSGRYLFNVIGQKASYLTISSAELKIETNKLSDYDISYFSDNKIHINTQSLYDEQKKTITLYNTEQESFTISNGNIKSSYSSDFLGNIKNIVINDELYTNSAKITEAFRDGTKDEYAISFASNSITNSNNYFITKYLVLEPGLATKNILQEGQEITVEILDYVQSDSNTNKKHLEQCLYDSTGQKTDYVYFKAESKHIDIGSFDFNIILSKIKPDLSRRNSKDIFIDKMSLGMLDFDFGNITLVEILNFILDSLDFVYYFPGSINNFDLKENSWYNINQNNVFKYTVAPKLLNKIIQTPEIAEKNKNNAKEFDDINFEIISRFLADFSTKGRASLKYNKDFDNVVLQNVIINPAAKAGTSYEEYLGRIGDVTLDNIGAILQNIIENKKADKTEKQEKTKGKNIDKKINTNTINSVEFGGLSLTPKQQS